MLAVSQTARHDASAATPDFSSRSSRPSHPDCRCTAHLLGSPEVPLRRPQEPMGAPQHDLARHRLTAAPLAALACAALLAAPAGAADRGLADLIQAGESNAALARIEAAADVNAAQGDGTTPLHWA